MQNVVSIAASDDLDHRLALRRLISFNVKIQANKFNFILSIYYTSLVLVGKCTYINTKPKESNLTIPKLQIPYYSTRILLLFIRNLFKTDNEIIEEMCE